MCLSVICVPEIISALNRRLREKNLTRRGYAQAKQRLSQEVRDTVIVNLAPDAIHSSIEVLETTSVRTMDAIHIASALAWGAELFASADHRQIVAAKTSGLKTKPV